mgnify:FL=1
MVGGRKRNFDKQEVLAKATLVFWQKGFIGASMTDLTDGMGINKPSLYSTFGNKAGLFVSATEYYVEHYGAPHFELLNDDKISLNQRLNNYIFSVIDMQCDANLPSGCFISLAAGETASNEMPEEAIDAIKNVILVNFIIFYFCFK